MATMIKGVSGQSLWYHIKWPVKKEEEKNWYLNFPHEQFFSLKSAQKKVLLFTFNGYLTIRPGADGVVRSASVSSLLWNIA